MLLGPARWALLRHGARIADMRIPMAALILASTTIPAQERVPTLERQAAGPATRIWSTATGDGQEVFFRRSFHLPERACLVRIVASCDDICSVAVNGKQLAEARMWEKVIVIDLESLPKGKNVIAVRGENRGGPAALALWVLWTDAKGKKCELVSDSKWRVSDEEQEGWQTPAFDDSKWQAAAGKERTPFGGTVYGTAPAEFEWVSGLAAATEAIQQAVESMRRARTDEAALRALDAIERAVMRARRELHKSKGQPPRKQ